MLMNLVSAKTMSHLLLKMASSFVLTQYQRVTYGRTDRTAVQLRHQECDLTETETELISYLLQLKAVLSAS